MAVELGLGQVTWAVRSRRAVFQQHLSPAQDVKRHRMTTQLGLKGGSAS